MMNKPLTGTSIRARRIERAKQMLPLGLFISFLAFPMVSTQAFRAFPCEEVGERFYLKADYTVECGSSADTLIKLWAALAVLLYPIGVPLYYAVLLSKVRITVLKNEATPLSEALGFLHRVFKPQFYWWELVCVAQKLILVGFFVLSPFNPGSFSQLILGLTVALLFAVLQMQVQPS
jgi:hypothetical protein